MPSNKKPRKKSTIKPRSIPITIRHSEEAETALQLAPHAELLKFREGIGDEQGWHTLVARLNVGLVAAWQNNQPNEDIKKGLDALLKIHARFDRLGKWGVSGNDLAEIGEALVHTDNLQLSLTRKQFALAIRYVFEHAAR